MATQGRLLQDRVVDLILESGLPSGAPLPSEPRLMEELGASRNSIRETLRALHTLGIVNIRHGYGTFVGEAPVTAMMPGLLFRARQDVSTLTNFIQVGRILETSLILDVPRPADAGFLAELESCVAETATGELVEADRRFHQMLYRGVNNELAVQFIDLFWAVHHRAQEEIEPPERFRAEISGEHQRIVDALRSGHAQAAAAAMDQHFVDIRRRSSRFMAKQHDPNSGGA